MTPATQPMRVTAGALLALAEHCESTADTLHVGLPTVAGQGGARQPSLTAVAEACAVIDADVDILGSRIRSTASTVRRAAGIFSADDTGSAELFASLDDRKAG